MKLGVGCGVGACLCVCIDYVLRLSSALSDYCNTFEMYNLYFIRAVVEYAYQYLSAG